MEFESNILNQQENEYAPIWEKYYREWAKEEYIN